MSYFILQIWDLSDPSGNGFLDKQGFFVALKLISLAQNGKDVNMSNINMQMPPPVMVCCRIYGFLSISFLIYQ